MIQETAVQVIDVAKGPLVCYLYKASCLFFLRMHYNQNDFSVYHFTACRMDILDMIVLTNVMTPVQAAIYLMVCVTSDVIQAGKENTVI